MIARSRWILPLALMLLAAAVRLHGISAGLPAINDPDELMFQLGALRMLRSGTLNPGWFGHPAAVTMHALAVVDVAVFLVGRLLGWWVDVKAFGVTIYGNPTLVMLPGRLVMAAFSLGCVWLTYVLARRLWDRAAGLAAGALVALSPVFVAWSQVIRSDIVACFFMLLAIDAAARRVASGRRRDLVFAALWTAAAIASKWPFAVVAGAFAGALWLRASVSGSGWRAAARAMTAYTMLTALFMICISPYFLLDWQTVVRNVAGESQQHHLGATGGTPGQNVWWYLSGPLWRGLGVLGCALSAFGAAALFRERGARALLLPPLTGFVLLLTFQTLVWERWALPVLVLAALLAGRGVSLLVERSAQGGRLPTALVPLVAAFALVQPLATTWREETARLNDTRQQAAAWALEHVGPGKRVFVEHFGFDLLPGPWDLEFPFGDRGCIDARAMLGSKIANSDVDRVRGSRAIVDYGTISPAAEATCAMDVAILTQADRYFAEDYRFPVEAERYRRLLANGRQIAVFRPQPGISAGPVVRVIAFDRP